MPFNVTLTERRQLTPHVFELTFTRPEGLNFRPGQHLRFHHKALERDYTPVGSPADPQIRFCIKEVPHPNFTALLARCPIGESFEISGPYGQFLLQAAPAPVVLVGTGTGIAPFAAYANSGQKELILLQGARNEDELIYRELFEKTLRLYVPCVSQAKGPGGDEIFHGRVTEFLDTRLPSGTYEFYLCGRREMIRDVTYIVDDKFPDSRIFTESFT